MPCLARATVSIDVIELFAEMAFFVRRSELGLLCRAAQESTDRIVDATLESVLPGLSAAARENVVRWCQSLGLCDRSGALSELGHEVARTNDAPVPEQGVYRMWLARHPLVGTRVLHVERQMPSAPRCPESSGRLPDDLPLGRRSTSVVDPQLSYVLRKVPSNHGAPSVDHAAHTTLELVWHLDTVTGDSCVEWQGVLSGRPVASPPESRPVDLVDLGWELGRALYEHGRYDMHEHRLACRFEHVAENPTALEHFEDHFELDGFEPRGLGRFERLGITDLPLAPLSGRDAERWAQARLLRRIDGTRYLTRDSLRALHRELVADTPLAEHRPALPAHDALVGGVERGSATWWALVAPLELSITPPAAHELAALPL